MLKQLKLMLMLKHQRQELHLKHLVERGKVKAEKVKILMKEMTLFGKKHQKMLN
jgi:hypothetical protein